MLEEGHHPAILTRGYRGLGQGDASGGAASDEVALLHQRLEGRAQFGVGKDRYKNGLALAKDGAEWFILDDGFQHLELQRDANIVLLDATDPFGGGGVLPAGRLREPRSGLARADIVIITRTQPRPRFGNDRAQIHEGADLLRTDSTRWGAPGAVVAGSFARKRATAIQIFRVLWHRKSRGIFRRPQKLGLFRCGAAQFRRSSSIFKC